MAPRALWPKKRPLGFPRGLLRCALLCFAIEAAGEERVNLLRVGHGEVLVSAVVAALEIETSREDLRIGSTILTNQAAEVGQPLTTPKGPERLLTEEQRRRVGLIAGCRQRGHR